MNNENVDWKLNLQYILSFVYEAVLSSVLSLIQSSQEFCTRASPCDLFYSGYFDFVLLYESYLPVPVRSSSTDLFFKVILSLSASPCVLSVFFLFGPSQTFLDVQYSLRVGRPSVFLVRFSPHKSRLRPPQSV